MVRGGGGGGHTNFVVHALFQLTHGSEPMSCAVTVKLRGGEDMCAYMQRLFVA